MHANYFGSAPASLIPCFLLVPSSVSAAEPCSIVLYWKDNIYQLVISLFFLVYFKLTTFLKRRLNNIIKIEYKATRYTHKNTLVIRQSLTKSPKGMLAALELKDQKPLNAKGMNSVERGLSECFSW